MDEKKEKLILVFSFNCIAWEKLEKYSSLGWNHCDVL